MNVIPFRVPAPRVLPSGEAEQKILAACRRIDETVAALEELLGPDGPDGHNLDERDELRYGSYARQVQDLRTVKAVARRIAECTKRSLGIA